MPINRADYPPDWPAVSARIRARSGGRCECDGRCGRPEQHPRGRCAALNAESHPVTGSRVVLTVAHLDHALVDHSDANLAAMCQRCHLAYDAAHRRAVGLLVSAPGPDERACGSVSRFTGRRCMAVAGHGQAHEWSDGVGWSCWP